MSARAIVRRQEVSVYAWSVVVPTLCAAMLLIWRAVELSNADVGSAITCAAILVAAIAIGWLVERAKRAEAEARRREARTRAMYELTCRLAEASSVEKLAAITVRHLGDLLDCRVLLLTPDASEALQLLAATDATELTTEELLAAQQVWRRAAHTDSATGHVISAAHLQPLVGSSRIGVLILRQRVSDAGARAADFELISVCARQAALAMERAALAAAVAAAELATERERVQNALLRSLSHDFRTPLASILCAGSTLLDLGTQLPESSRAELAHTVVEESERLNRLLTNVLSMTRLEAVQATVKKVVQPLDEIVSDALGHLGQRLRERPWFFSAPDELLLVAADAVLLEQLVINVVENSLRYTPPGSPIEIVLEARGSQAVVRISDRGPGVLPGTEAQLFEKFYRAPSSLLNDGGLGLGLTICSAIAQAHGGVIEASNRDGGGLTVSLLLPREQPEIAAALALSVFDGRGKAAIHL